MLVYVCLSCFRLSVCVDICVVVFLTRVGWVVIWLPFGFVDCRSCCFEGFTIGCVCAAWYFLGAIVTGFTDCYICF